MAGFFLTDKQLLFTPHLTDRYQNHPKIFLEELTSSLGMILGNNYFKTSFGREMQSSFINIYQIQTLLRF